MNREGAPLRSARCTLLRGDQGEYAAEMRGKKGNAGQCVQDHVLWNVIRVVDRVETGHERAETGFYRRPRAADGLIGLIGSNKLHDLFFKFVARRSDTKLCCKASINDQQQKQRLDEPQQFKLA